MFARFAEDVPAAAVHRYDEGETVDGEPFHRFASQFRERDLLGRNDVAGDQGARSAHRAEIDGTGLADGADDLVVPFAFPDGGREAEPVQTGREAVCLPSTSPANAQWSFARLCDAWRVVAAAAEEDFAL